MTGDKIWRSFQIKTGREGEIVWISEGFGVALADAVRKAIEDIEKEKIAGIADDRLIYEGGLLTATVRAADLATSTFPPADRRRWIVVAPIVGREVVPVDGTLADAVRLAVAAIEAEEHSGWDRTILATDGVDDRLTVVKVVRCGIVKCWNYPQEEDMDYAPPDDDDDDHGEGESDAPR